MAGILTLRTAKWLRLPYEKLLDHLVTQFGYINTMNAELFDDNMITFTIPTHASRTVYNIFTATRGFTVTDIRVTPNVAQGSALTATIVKASSTGTPSAGTTPMCAAGAINLNGTAHTTQTITLTSTAADLVVSSGQKISIVLSGALSTGEANVTIALKKN